MQNSQKDLHKKLLGRKGEKLARKTLKKRGFKILCKNYVCPLGEIDIVALDYPYIVFCEVKTKESGEFLPASASVNFKKQRKYALLAKYFLKEKNLEDNYCRFDVVEINGKEINYIENAFEEK